MTMKPLLRTLAHSFAALCAALIQLPASGCTDLDLSGAHRCNESSDCDPGRICSEQKICVDRSANMSADGGAQPDGGGPRYRWAVLPRGMNEPRYAFDPSRLGQGEPSAGGGGGANSAGHAEPSDSGHDSGTDDRDADTPDSDPDADVIAPEPLPSDGRNDVCASSFFKWSEVALWLNAEKGITETQGKVSGWADRSSYRHHALPPNADPVSWPVRVPSTEILPHAAIRFGFTPEPIEAPPARRLEIADHEALQVGLDNFAIIAVLRYRNRTVAGADEIGSVFAKVCFLCPGFPGPALFANDNWATPIRGAFLFQTVYGEHVSSNQSGLNDDALHVVAAGRINNFRFVAVDGPEYAFQDDGLPWDVSAPGKPVVLGVNPAGDRQVLDGDIFELMLVRGATSERWQNIVSCLKAKYELP